MAKKGGFQKRSTKTRKDIDENAYDDEIDAFHKQRDIVPLDVNDDTDESDEDDDVHPVFDIKDADEDEDEEDEDTEDEEESEKGLAAKMVRQKKYLRAKFGDADDKMADDDNDNDEQEKRDTWGGRKSQYYNGDNANFELQSSDDEDLKEEEEEVLRLRAEQAGNITAADAGLESDSEEESDRELTMEEIAVKGKHATTKEKDGKETHVEEIKKDLNSLSKEEQMDVVYSSAPEIVGLLSELNDAHEELETKINPILNKLKEAEIPSNGGTRYLEVKQRLLLTYCQSITFYLLLKSEGQPIRDHPVLGRLVEIKALLDKIKELDGNLPPGFEESLLRSIGDGTVKNVVKDDTLTSAIKSTQDTSEPMKIDEIKEVKKKKNKGEKRKHQNKQVDMQSEEMLKLRAALEGKLRSKGVLGSTVSKSDKAQKRQKLANKKLETFDDYVDDADNSTHDGKLGKLVYTTRKPKIISGDDDLPQRDDIGERRRKYELRILNEAGVKSEDGKNETDAFASDEDNENDDDNDNDMVDNDGESEDEFYKQVKRKQQAKRAAKAETYSWEHVLPSLPESADGKRLISKKMVANRGLTRQRNKDLKNPRKKYRLKHEDKLKRHKGVKPDARKPSGPYGGEASGINPNKSSSVRIKN
ncbi:unnamed protein product [Cochlearia groenlandica]